MSTILSRSAVDGWRRRRTVAVTRRRATTARTTRSSVTDVGGSGQVTTAAESSRGPDQPYCGAGLSVWCGAVVSGDGGGDRERIRSRPSVPSSLSVFGQVRAFWRGNRGKGGKGERAGGWHEHEHEEIRRMSLSSKEKPEWRTYRGKRRERDGGGGGECVGCGRGRSFFGHMGGRCQ